MTEPAAQSLLQLALQAHQSNQFELARARYQSVLESEPGNADALHLLGLVHCQQGSLQEAESSIRKAIGVSPTTAAFHGSLGNVQRSAGQLKQAKECYQKAVALAPELSENHYNLALCLHDLGEITPAKQAFKKALQQNEQGRYHYSLGVLLQREDDFEQAAYHYRLALKISPNDALALNALSTIYKEQGLLSDAKQYLQQSLAIDENSATAHSNLANIFKHQGLMPEAILHYQKALALNPQHTVAYDNYLYCLNCADTASPLELGAEHRRWAHYFQQLWPENRLSRHTQDEKIRIGYLSPDFKQHSVASNVFPLLKHHDKTQFEVFCYSDVATPDAITEKIKNTVANWRSISQMPHQDVCELIRRDNLDILVDLTGHTSHNRLAVFALRAAPMQISAIGYPNTTGLTTMDYRLTDALTDPIGETETFHSETLLRLANCFLVYEPLTPPPDVNNLPFHTSQKITFGSFNTLGKLSDSVVSTWSQLLDAVPNSQLTLKAKGFIDEATKQLVLLRFAKQGIGADRLQLLGWLPECQDHLSLYHDIDIALDPFPYNGTVTSLEALTMGVPFISLIGRHHVARVGLSLLSAVGLEHLAVNSHDDYVNAAIALAADHEKLASLRQNLRGILQKSGIMDYQTKTKAFEDCLKTALANHQ